MRQDVVTAPNDIVSGSALLVGVAMVTTRGLSWACTLVRMRLLWQQSWNVQVGASSRGDTTHSNYASGCGRRGRGYTISVRGRPKITSISFSKRALQCIHFSAVKLGQCSKVVSRLFHTSLQCRGNAMLQQCRSQCVAVG